MKKTISVLIAVILVITIFSAVSVSAADAELLPTAEELYYDQVERELEAAVEITSGDFTFELLEDSPNVRITDYTAGGDSLTVPSKIGGYKVTEISMLPSDSVDSLKSISIPNSVTFVDGWSFDNSKWFSNQPNGPVYIGKCLYKCKGICPENVTVRPGTVSISPYAFDDCTTLKSISIPDSVTTIGDCAFAGCTNLKTMELPDSVTEIGACAFLGCTFLTTVKLPASVKTVREFAFSDCSALKTITAPDEIPTIEKDAFIETAWWNAQADGVVYFGKTAYGCKGDCPASVELRAGTLSIADGAFADQGALESIKIPDTVKRIGYGAFSGCTSMTSIDIPASVTEIGSMAFDAPSLKTISFPASVTSVGADAVGKNTAWYQSQPDGMIYIGKAAYQYKGTCPAKVDLRAGTVSISCDAFYGCDTLQSITIPDTVTQIGSLAFAGCAALKQVTVPQAIETIGLRAFGYSGGNFERGGDSDDDDDWWDDADELYPDDDDWWDDGDGAYYDDYEDEYEDDYQAYKYDGFTIKGYTGTESEEYAVANGFAFVSLGGTPKPTVLCGDADNDGEVTILDATRIQRWLAEICGMDGSAFSGAALSDHELKAADVDDDDVVTIIDATSIQRHIADLPTSAQGIGDPV